MSKSGIGLKFKNISSPKIKQHFFFHHFWKKVNREKVLEDFLEVYFARKMENSGSI